MYSIGQKVAVIDNLNGHNRHVCYGTVVKLTPAQVHIRNEHGNLDKFWQKNNQVVGYKWPNVTYILKPA